MAVLKASLPLDMFETTVWYGAAVVANSSTIKITDGYRTQVYSGTFYYDYWGDVYGTLRATTAYIGGSTSYSVTGLRLDANLVNYYLDIGDGETLQQYALAGNDTLTGSKYYDVLRGHTGDDVLNGGAGADVLIGGVGNDKYYIDNPSDWITELSGQGIDTVYSSISFALTTYLENLTLTGSAAASGTGNELGNVLTGNAAANLLTGLGGNDVLNGAGGADQMFGGLGDDTYTVNHAADAVVEVDGEGTDTVRSTISHSLGDNVENLVLLGTAVSGTGNELNNTITGTAAANTLDGGGGDDVMAGGLGNDTYKVDSAADAVVEAAAGGTDTVQSTVSFALADHLEKLVLTGGGDIDGTGNALNNVLTGNSGANRLDGGAGADTMSGGSGDDTYVVNAVGDKAIESSAAGGADTVESAVSFVLGANLENLALTGSGNLNGTGNALANSLTGNAGNNLLSGGLGADALAGGLGDDTYVVDNAGDSVTEAAGEGTDLVRSSVAHVLGANVENLTLTGSAAASGTGNELGNVLTGNAAANLLTGLGGNDVLNGAGGSDRLDGGAGGDEMRGGAGNDVFVLRAGQTEGDSILDFLGNGASLGDSLRLEGFGAGASLTNGDGDDVWTVLYNGGADSEDFQIAGVTTLSNGDFLFA